MEKIKIIDLLNKIANGEKVPKKIKYDEKIFEYDYSVNDFRYEYKDNYSQDTLWFNEYMCNLTNCLNDEVEIIEEDKKIKKIGIINYTETPTEAILHNKIDEIIDYLNSKEKE